MAKMHTEVENFYISYSDMVTLLFIFFVWLFSMSTLDANKFAENASAVQDEMSKSTSSKLQEIEKQQEKLKEMNETIKAYIEQAKLKDEISLKFNKGELELNLGESVLFEPGQAILKPQASGIMRKISDLLKKNDSLIQIEGHTDNIPINTKSFPSNWELSAARAAVVARIMENDNVPASRMTVIGKGEHHPLAPNSSSSNRAKNRRVSILLKVDSEKILKKK